MVGAGCIGRLLGESEAASGEVPDTVLVVGDIT